MSEKEIIQGKTWVENKLRSTATEFGIKIDISGWRSARGIEYLTYIMDDKCHIEKFSEDNLEDCLNDNAVKKILADHLRKMVASACSSKPKIGFNCT